MLLIKQMNIEEQRWQKKPEFRITSSMKPHYFYHILLVAKTCLSLTNFCREIQIIFFYSLFTQEIIEFGDKMNTEKKFLHFSKFRINIRRTLKKDKSIK